MNNHIETLKFFLSLEGIPIQKMLEGLCDPVDVEHKLGRLDSDMTATATSTTRVATTERQKPKVVSFGNVKFII